MIWSPSSAKTSLRYIDKHCRDNDAQLVEQFKFVCYLSKYVYNCLQIDPELAHELLASGDLQRQYDRDDYRSAFAHVDLESIDFRLRKVRRREMIQDHLSRPDKIGQPK